ncbi:hypothetical protein KIN20_028999 [Parelaphostrongylus tenuis]|uniref:Uncharacterized protein n=1 Tax=Parelaphostrongylus tenuis TaxID=148309 RepID=A0AAD5R202_PARTN|nr:hypothetical protein KIN20_028999 [Parelaphostrongylus tenuis]
MSGGIGDAVIARIFHMSRARAQLSPRSSLRFPQNSPRFKWVTLRFERGLSSTSRSSAMRSVESSLHPADLLVVAIPFNFAASRRL